MNLRTTTFFVLALALTYRLLRGRATRKPSEIRTVAVANFTGNLGDMIFTTPVFRAIKVAYPKARVIVIGSKKNGLFLEGSTDIDRYLVWTEFWASLRALRTERPDVGIAVNPSPLEVGMLYLAGASLITVYTHLSVITRAWRLLSTLVHTMPYTPGKYVAKEYLRLLEPAGIRSDDTNKHVPLLAEVRTAVKNMLVEKGFLETGKKLVALSPTAGLDAREWPPERFGQVARHVVEKYGASFVLVGGKFEGRERDAFFAALPPHARVLDFLMKPLEETKALVALSSLIIANDSGLVYVAEAFGVPTLVIAGVHDSNEHPRRTTINRVVDAPVRHITLHTITSDLVKVDMEKAREQMRSITTEAVIRELDSLWPNLK